MSKILQKNMEMLFEWKKNGSHTNRCMLYDDEGCTSVSLFIRWRHSNDVLIIKSLEDSSKLVEMCQIEFDQIAKIVSGVTKINREITKATVTNAALFLSLVVTNKINPIHLKFVSESQRNNWLRMLHQHIMASNKKFYGHHKKNKTNTAVIIDYFAKSDDENQNDDDEHKEKESSVEECTQDIDSLILSPDKLQKIGIILQGSYLKIPRIHSDRTTIFNSLSNSLSQRLSPNKSIRKSSEQIFIKLDKSTPISSRFTCLKWAKNRNLIQTTDDHLLECGNITHIDYISVCFSPNHDPEDETHIHDYYLEIEWDEKSKVGTSLILTHSSLDLLWDFANALAHSCDVNGITEEQAMKAMSPKRPSKSDEIDVFVCTFNVAANLNQQGLQDLLHANDKVPDFYAVSFQEIVDLNKSSTYLNTDTESSGFWKSELDHMLINYAMVESVCRGGLILLLYANKNIISEISQIASGAHNVGLMGAANKAAVAIRIKLRNQNICFVAAHLPAGQSQFALRNDAYFRILDELVLKGDGSFPETKIDDHDVIFWFGDLNYRLNIDLSKINDVFEIIKVKNVKRLLKYDQLSLCKQNKQAFVGFEECQITFLPTYKYRIGHNQFETRSVKKLRMPSYTDRILHKINKKGIKIESKMYNSFRQMTLSDHKPVYGSYQICLSGVVEHEKKRSSDIASHLHKLGKLQKLYNDDVISGIKSLESEQSQESKDKVIAFIEKSQRELVSAMNALLQSLKSTPMSNDRCINTRAMLHQSH